MKSIINSLIKNKISLLLFMLYFIGYSEINLLSAQIKKSVKSEIKYKSEQMIDSTWIMKLDANNIYYWICNSGEITYDRLHYEPGMGWKNNPSDFLGLFCSSGFYIGCMKPYLNGDTISVSQVEYEAEYRAGRILNQGPVDSLVTEDSNSAGARLFVLPEHSALWPAEAPHNESGEPLQLSAKDTWAVFNDLAAANIPVFYSPAPKLGLEIQRQTFQFLEYPFNNSVVVRMRIINKSNNTYDSCYFGLWADTDIEDATPNDDVSGIDSTLPCIYTYNNPSGYDTNTSIAGLLLLQSPLKNGNIQDTANVVDISTNGFYIDKVINKKQAPPSGGITYWNDGGAPSGYDGKQDLTRYWYMSGYEMLGQPKPLGKFDINYTNPQDISTVIGAGSFSLIPNDTQVVWYALIGAKGTTKLNSVDSLLSHAYLMKEIFYTDMNSIVVGINDEHSNHPPAFTLHQNYPNPFNPSTTIRYQIPADEKVSLKIYNTLGQEIRTLVNTKQNTGLYTIQWDGKNIQGRPVSSGIYIYRLKAGNDVKSQKMMLIR